MANSGLGWMQSKSTVLGSRVALVAGLLAIVFAFAMTGEQTLFNEVVSMGGLAAIIAFAIGLLLYRRGAGQKASMGFLGLVVSVLVLGVGYAAVDPIQTAGTTWQGLDFVLVLVGDVAALVGGILLGISLGSLAGGSVFAKASGYAFLVGGVIQMGAGLPDLGSIVTESSSLGDIGHMLDGLAGIVFVVIGPAFLYVAVRQARRPSAG